MPETFVDARVAVAAALRAERDEIDQALLARAYSISAVPDAVEPAYKRGMRLAIAAAVDFGIAAVEAGEDDVHPVPTAVLEQAGSAARNGIALDVVLRRYLAGFALFTERVLHMAESSIFDRATARHLLRAPALQFDRLLAAVSDEYTRARASRLRSVEQRRAEKVRRLLTGEPVDIGDIAYDLSGWHLALLVVGDDASEAIRSVTQSWPCGHLHARMEDQAIWAWLGAPDREAVERARFDLPTAPGVRLSVGEPALGLAGWRLTHRQADAAMQVALRRRTGVVHYAEVALLASVLQSDLLLESIRGAYLSPLQEERDGGAMLIETLRAYFSTGRNASSAAHAIGVSRQTVTNRLKAVEQRIGYELDRCFLELELALRVHDLLEGDERSTTSLAQCK